VRLETDRLVLRSMRPQDIAQLVSLWTDPDVTRFVGGPRHGDAVRTALEQDLVEAMDDSMDLWPTVEKASGAVVGHCGLLEKEVAGRAEVELVYVLSRAVWGRGYATEIGQALMRLSFDELGVERLVSLIDPDNEASRRVAGKLGMRRASLVARPDGADRELWVIERDAPLVHPDRTID
jgi:[ribosomal protein S5]-alanine N-acetyltransferase